jgi:hypothetical protein
LWPPEITALNTFKTMKMYFDQRLFSTEMPHFEQPGFRAFENVLVAVTSSTFVESISHFSMKYDGVTQKAGRTIFETFNMKSMV